MSTPSPVIEFWFDFASNYSHLSAQRIEGEAARRGVRVSWRPFLLGPIFQSFGWNNSPFVLQKEKGAYAWKDMERQCRKYGAGWKMPSQFPRLSVLPARVALAGSEERWVGEFTRRVMDLNFAQDQDISATPVIAQALTDMGLPADEILQRAQADDNKQRLREQTEVARSRGVFGAPTFFVRGEMFWGNDRLDDALEFALQP